MTMKRSNRSEIRGLGLLSVAVVLLAGGVLLPATNTLAAVQAPAPVSVSINPSHRAQISLGDGLHLRGVVTSNGTPSPALSVRLEAQPFPYRNPFHAVGSARTGQNGAYDFLQAPSHNTRYRVVVTSHPSQRSSAVTVYVGAKFSKCTFNGQVTRIRVTCALHFARGVHEQGRQVYWYLGLNHSLRERHVSTTRIPAPTQPGLIHLVHVYRVKAGWTFANYAVYIRDLPGQGFGAPTCLDRFGFWVGGNQCAPPASLSTKTAKP